MRGVGGGGRGREGGRGRVETVHLVGELIDILSVERKENIIDLKLPQKSYFAEDLINFLIIFLSLRVDQNINMLFII